MKRILSVLLLVGMVFFVAGCEKDDKNNLVVVTQADNGSEVSVAEGDDVAVILSGNPTTGYQWEVVETDVSMLRLVSTSYKPDSDAVGSGGSYLFLFKAIAVGEVHLRLVYKRSWEAEIADTFKVTLGIM